MTGELMDRAAGGMAGTAGRSAGDVLLAAESLAVSFGPTPALVDASVAVWPGGVLAILGPSGSGKSTLLHCLAEAGGTPAAPQHLEAG